MHLDEQAAAVLARLEAAPAVGQRLRQHGHHAVGEVDRVAAALRIVIECGVGADILRDVGDGDDEAEAVLLAFGENRVVEVPRVLAVDRDQRHRAQVGAPAERHAARPLGLGERGGRELGRDAERVDAHEADRAGIADTAEPLDDARLLQPEGRGRQRARQDDLVRLGAAGLARRNAPLGLGAPLRREQPVRRAEHAEDAPRCVGQPLERAALVALAAAGAAAGLDRRQPGKHPLARRERRLAAPLGLHEDDRRRPVALPIDRAGDRIAAAVGAGDQHDGCVGQPAGRGEAAVTGRGDGAVRCQRAQHAA